MADTKTTKAPAKKAPAAKKEAAPKAAAAPKAKAPAAKKTPSGKTVTIRQTRSPIGRLANQRKTLIGLGLNKIGRTSTLEDTPSVRGMIATVAHLVEVQNDAA